MVGNVGAAAAAIAIRARAVSRQRDALLGAGGVDDGGRAVGCCRDEGRNDRFEIKLDCAVEHGWPE